MDTRELLIQKATDIRPMAHAPYSNFWVGAALITEDGEFFTGVNFENASYGLTICAERNAIGTMITAGQKSIKALAVATENGVTPCGACRQVMVEFAQNDFPVFIVNSTTGEVIDTTAYQLLPESFDSSQLPS
ncbi:MAG: cytidine deaminase [Anaerolineae bacterium]